MNKIMKDNIYDEIKDQSQRLGLALGGGGAKGCYEIGALQAFKECGIHFDCVAGTSIGAIVGAIYACGNDDRLVDFTIDMKPTDVVEDLVIPENVHEALAGKEKMLKVAEHYAKYRGVDVTPLKKKLDEMFDYDQFEKSDVDYACTTFNYTQLKPVPWFKNQGITRENVKDVVIASASCFPAFPMQEIDGDLYVDGGYDNNLPVDLVLEMHAEKIIAIDVKGVGLYKPKIIKPTIAYWEPLVPLGNFLDFRSKEGMRSMQLGYLETLKRLDRIPGFIYSFKKDDFRKMIDFENYMQIYAQKLDITLDKSIKKRFMGKAVPDLRSKYTRIFLYEIVLEYLATAVNMDPSHVYRFDEFMNELHDKLKSKKIEITSIFELDEFIDDRKLEVIRLLRNGLDKKIPKAIREIDYVEDFIALAGVWKGLDEFLKK